MVHDEGTREGEVSATGVLDLSRAFEHVTMNVLWVVAPLCGFPQQLAKLLISIYTSTRLVAFRGVLAKKSLQTFSAVVAGSI
eukprot:1056389-Pyramimonas_sp.AAC.1